MSVRTAFDPLPDDVPPDIDITKPQYLFGKVEWDVPPFLICNTATQRAHLSRREKQDELYRHVGNPIMWDQYIMIGYYTYDDCFQFETQWTKMGRNLLEKYKFIWFSYTYHKKRYLMPSDELEAWANNIAQPYLLKHYPDGYHPDTSDPRTGRYDDTDDDMEIEDDRKPAAVDNPADKTEPWITMGANGKPIKNPPPQSTVENIPPADAVAHVPQKHPTNPPPPIKNPMNPPSHNPRTNPGTLRQTFSRQRVSHNDGTLRITIRWSPLGYETLKPTTGIEWKTQATDALHFLLYTAPDCRFHQWDPTATQTTIPLLSLTPDNLLDYISPNITEMSSKDTFIFAIRVSMCSGGSPGPWINNQATQAALFTHRLEVSISNATSDSGDVMIAGYILLKDPSTTHRIHYTSLLRENLPNLPFFDIGLHQRSPNGVEVPHLVIRCGGNVVEQLSANLSAYLNGTSTTPIFLSRVHMMNTSPEEVNSIFDIHSCFLKKLHRISLSPHILHIDRIRTERAFGDTPSIDRSTRTWAASLTDKYGTSMQCDVECGSSDRQIYLLVPDHHIARAKAELKNYMSRLLHLRPTTVLNYTPSNEVITNVGFLKQMAQSNLWHNSPSEFPPNTQQSPAASNNQNHKPINISQSPSPHPQRDDTSLGTASQQTSQNTTFSKFNYARRMTTGDDNTMATTQLSLSATHISRFDEMEATILRQQEEYKTVLTRFDTVEDQALRTMAVCQASSRSILDLRKDSLQQMSNLRKESAESLQQIRDESAKNQRELQIQLRLLQSTMTSFIRDSKPRSKSSSSESTESRVNELDVSSDDSMSTSSQQSSLDELTDLTQSQPNATVLSHQPRSSSKNKKRNSLESKSTDQASAQNNNPSAPDGPEI